MTEPRTPSVAASPSEPSARAQRESAQTAEDKIFVASQGQLMWWRFRKHKPAIVGGIIVILVYLVALFCEFLAPYDPVKYDQKDTYAPPQRIRIVDQGKVQSPFVYGLTQSRDPVSYRMMFQVDQGKKYPVRFFVRGSAYKMWGLFEGDLHLFGIDDPEGSIHLLGADRMGRDVFSRLVYGARVSMSIGLVGVILSFVLGITIGGFSGYYGGALDTVVQRIIEFIRSVPSIPLWMALSAALPVDWPPTKIYFGITVVLSLIGWTWLARVVRSQFLSIREEDYVMAARLSGTGEVRIIYRHMVPAFMSYIIAQMSLSIPNMILSETSLSFLGLGIRAPAISWGVLLQEAQNLRAVALAPWLLAPGLAVVLIVLAFNFLGDGLRDAADPYSR
ncbi:MAG: ABC transporter permease [Chloroflexi bacterium]|nr:ABC transporter permease [Chloroflexota bacterium]